MMSSMAPILAYLLRDDHTVVVEVLHRLPQMLGAGLTVLPAAVSVRLPHGRPVIQAGRVPHPNTVAEVDVPERPGAQRPPTAVIDGFDLHRCPPLDSRSYQCFGEPVNADCGDSIPPLGDKMTLYARSDVMSVSIPVTSGGCGKSHSRPVRNGAPAKEFELSCPGCENFLKGGGRQVLKQNPIDKETRTGGELVRVTDVDPQWGSTPESAPETPDEQTYVAKRNKQGQEELQMIQALAFAKQAGIEIPANAMEMLQRRLPGVLGGNGQSTAVIEAPKYGLDDLSTEKLKAIAKSQGLPTSGSRAQLIERLS